MRREIAAAEEAAHEGGELNLVPYLDIVVNTVIFMLATTALTIGVGNIDLVARRYVPPSQYPAAVAAPPSLDLTVGVTYSGFVVGGSGAILPTIPCKRPLSRGRCPARPSRGIDAYDYATLGRTLRDVKKRYPSERKAILTADRNVPYEVLIRSMDALRASGFDRVTLSAGVQ